MFKEGLIESLIELNQEFANIGQSGYLTIGLGEFNAPMYTYIQTIMTNVVMPVAYVILAL